MHVYTHAPTHARTHCYLSTITVNQMRMWGQPYLLVLEHALKQNACVGLTATLTSAVLAWMQVHVRSTSPILTGT